jgi:hypothetical protein
MKIKESAFRREIEALKNGGESTLNVKDAGSEHQPLLAGGAHGGNFHGVGSLSDKNAGASIEQPSLKSATLHWSDFSLFAGVKTGFDRNEGIRKHEESCAEMEASVKAFYGGGKRGLITNCLSEGHNRQLEGVTNGTISAAEKELKGLESEFANANGEIEKTKSRFGQNCDDKSVVWGLKNDVGRLSEDEKCLEDEIRLCEIRAGRLEPKRDKAGIDSLKKKAKEARSCLEINRERQGEIKKKIEDFSKSLVKKKELEGKIVGKKNEIALAKIQQFKRNAPAEATLYSKSPLKEDPVKMPIESLIAKFVDALNELRRSYPGNAILEGNINVMYRAVRDRANDPSILESERKRLRNVHNESINFVLSLEKSAKKST